ncbi:MAG: right-handed parallel beta-helix repeat-containing protein [Synergistales bacterium]|nr:right-handed parallel beta-helix repeat-containing protein [Synergistales bacterium]
MLGICAVALFVLSGAATGEAARWYVAENGRGDGTTWARASADLMGILDKADPGDEIWVAEGEYLPVKTYEPTHEERATAFDLSRGVALYGGFDGGESSLSERDFEFNETTLSGNIGNPAVSADNSYQVVTADDPDASSEDDDQNVVIDGFTIEGGYADRAPVDPSEPVYHIGAGMHTSYMENITIRNCTFRDNHATGYAGGLSGYRCRITVEQSTFEDNSAQLGGGAMVSHCYSADIAGCTFTGNIATESGGGLLDNDSNLVLEDCTFSSNNAEDGDGGGVVSHVLDSYPENNADPVIRRCAFLDNQAEGEGGALCCKDNDPTIINCTFSGNRSTGKGGAFAAQDGNETRFRFCTFAGNAAQGGGDCIALADARVAAVNSILWGDQRDRIIDVGDDARITADSCVLNRSDLDSLGDNNTNGNPKLEEPADNDGPTKTCVIASGSSARNAASSGDVPDTDQRGKPRPSGDGPDIGAFELQESSSPGGGGGGCSVGVASFAAALLLIPGVLALRRR